MPERSFGRIAALAAILLLPRLSPAEEPSAGKPYRIEGLMPIGTIKRVLEPDYPAALLAGQAKTYVDISGSVSPFGELENIEFSAESDEARMMVQPLKEVLRYWEFIVPFDDECLPAPVVIRNRVWFEFGGERVKLSVLRLTKDPGVGDGYSYKALKRVEPKYPYGMLRSGQQAHVFAKVKVSSEGPVLEVKATAYPAEHRDRLNDFESATVEAINKWVFPPRAKGNWTGCYTVVFRLRN